jgi:hypothetical protein
LLLLVVILAACGNPSGPDAHGDCDLVVRIEGVLYALQADEQVSAGFTPGAPYASVAGRKDCTDFVADGQPVSGVLADGESTFLPAGTPLYPATGFEVTDRLVAQWNGDWVFVVEKVLH